MAVNETPYEVIVVGGGGAGLTAALSAARLGRSVLLLEKNSALGGTTRLSVGSISVSCTRLQKRLSVSDSPEEHFEDMGKFAGELEVRDNLELRRLFVEEAPEAFRFLVDLGLEFMDPIPEPPNRYPRLHNVLPHSGSIVFRLERACRKEGVEIVLGASVSELEQARDRIVAVLLEDGRRFSASRGVVLASGDYSSAAADLKGDLLSADIAAIEGINQSSTGDGQRMGRTVGGEIVNSDLAWGPELRFLAPPHPSVITRIPPVRPFARAMTWIVRKVPNAFLRPFMMSFVTTFLAPSHGLFKEGGILVNKDGQRFCDETSGPEREVVQQPDGFAYILLDAATAGKFAAWPHFVSTAPGVGYAYLPDYQRSRPDVCHVADTLVRVAEKARLPSQALEQTVADYNNVGRGKRPEILGGPYYLLGPLKSWICFTEGGLRVNGSLQVQRSDGSNIEALYAAGSAGQGGLLLEGHGHHLAWAIVSGRIAGRSAAFAPIVSREVMQNSREVRTDNTEATNMESN